MAARGIVLRDAGLMAGVGISAGLALSVVAAMFMRGLLFGTPPWDAATLAAVSLVLGATALFAAWLPARRAASMDPVEALRIE